MKKLMVMFLSGTFFLVFLLSTGAANRMMSGKMCDMMGRMPARGIDPGDLPDADSDSAKTYASFCSQCHALPNPRRNSANDWKTLVNRMDGRMRMMSRMGGGMMGMMMNRRRVQAMSASDKETIIRYLQKHSLEALDKSKVTSLNTPGYRAFEKVCSQCHALPDPSARQKSEWPTIVRKMKNIMAESGVDLPDAEEEKQILDFLDEWR